MALSCFLHIPGLLWEDFAAQVQDWKWVRYAYGFTDFEDREIPDVIL